MVIKGGAVMNMVAFGKKVVKFRIPILIISILLLIPAGLGYVNTRVNYDVLTYLPEDIETMQGQDILVKDFGTGAFSMFIVDGMEDKDVSALKAKIEKSRSCAEGSVVRFTCRYQHAEEHDAERCLRSIQFRYGHDDGNLL